MRSRPTSPGQLYRPRPREKPKDPLGEELGDPREGALEHEGELPETWYASSPEEIYAQQLEERYGGQGDYQSDNLALTDAIDAQVDRAVDWEERFWNELDPKGTYETPPRPPGEPPGEPPGPPEVPAQDALGLGTFEALRANDNIDIVIERADTDTGHTIVEYFKRGLDIYVSANTWRYEPRSWFRHPTKKNICHYVERRDHKGSGNRKGKKRGLAEQQQIKLFYLCRG